MLCFFSDGRGVDVQLVLQHLCPAAALDVRCVEQNEVLASLAGVARGVAVAASNLARAKACSSLLLGNTWPARGLTLNSWRGNIGRLDGTGDSLTGASDVLSPWSGSGVRVSFVRSWAVSGGLDRGGGRHVSSRPPSSVPAACSGWPTQ